ncbi:exonuclease domain-containing protein [Corynebacterium ureicelerivorans]
MDPQPGHPNHTNHHAGFAVVDLETTGVMLHDRIVEIGVVLLRPDLTVERTWETLIQPERDIPNSYIHKITATDVVDAPAFRDVAAYLGSLLHGRALVAHNAPFERRFLTHEFARAKAENGLTQSWVDTMTLSNQHLGVKKLEQALAVAQIHNPLAHSALADAQATAELLRYFRACHDVALTGFPTAVFLAPAAEPRILPRGTSSGWSGQLSRTLPATGTKDEEAYRAELTCALVDRHISRTEMRQLEQAAIASGLDADDVDAINEEFTRQLVVEAWSDGVITAEERTELLAVADALSVDPALMHSLLDEPQAGTAPGQFTLHPGDRIALTGAMDIARDVWVQRATAAGLEVGDVTRKCVLLVAANPDSMSGKAQKARKYGIPVVGETKFAQLLGTIDNEPVSEQPAASELLADSARIELPEQFSWLSPEHVSTTGAPSSQIAAAWIALHPTRPLHEMAENLKPHHVPEATGRGIDRYLAVWSLEHPEMLRVSADDLLQLSGVGPKRRSQLVEMVVDLAVDGVPEGPAQQTDAADAAATTPVASPPVDRAFTPPKPAAETQPVLSQRPASTASLPEAEPQEPAPSDPTPEELLAAANAPRYTPAPAPSSLSAPALTDPAHAPVKRPRATKVFKWSASLGILCFFLFGLCIETFDPDAESFFAGVFALGFLLAGLTATISGVMALFNVVRGK